MTDDKCAFCGSVVSTISSTGIHFYCNSIQRKKSETYSRSMYCKSLEQQDQRLDACVPPDHEDISPKETPQ